MITDIEQIIKEMQDFASDKSEEFKLTFLSKKGKIQELFDEFRNVRPEEKKELGQRLNALKNMAQARLVELQAKEQQKFTASKIEDMTRDVAGDSIGSIHPLTLVRREICDNIDGTAHQFYNFISNSHNQTTVLIFCPNGFIILINPCHSYAESKCRLIRKL